MNVETSLYLSQCSLINIFLKGLSLKWSKYVGIEAQLLSEPEKLQASMSERVVDNKNRLSIFNYALQNNVRRHAGYLDLMQ